jgi:hypothetical protein
MGAEVLQDKNGIWVLKVSGALRKEELDAAQSEAVRALGFNDEARVLVVIADDFCGWVGGEVWGDTTFFFEHGDRISKIALVGDPRWEEKMLMFTGAGLRRAPVKYFEKGELAAAYAWLA